MTAEHLSKMHGFEYLKAYSTITINEQLESFYEASENPKILEIFTPSVENDLVLKNYFKYIQ